MGTDEQPDRTVVWLGNRNAIEVIHTDDDGPGERRALPAGKRCTTVILAPGTPLMEAAYDLTHPGRGVWQAHSDDTAPAWVASTDPMLASVLAAHWATELRDPDPADRAAAGQLTADLDAEG